MKTRKLLTLLMAAVLLVASLGLTAHADVDIYSFSGNCKRFFTTTRYLEQQDKEWTRYAAVFCKELSFTGSPSYDHGWAIIIDGSGVEYGYKRAVYWDEYDEDDQTLLTIFDGYDYTTIRVRLIHPYYKANSTTATSTMHIAGYVGKQILC